MKKEPVLQSIEEWTGHRKPKNSLGHDLSRLRRKFRLAKAIKRRRGIVAHKDYMRSIIPPRKPSNRPEYKNCTELFPCDTYDFLNPILFLSENFRCDDKVYEIQDCIQEVNYAMVRSSRLIDQPFIKRIIKPTDDQTCGDKFGFWMLNMLSKSDVIGIYFSEDGNCESNSYVSDSYMMLLLLQCFNTPTKIVVGLSDKFVLRDYVKMACQKNGVPIATDFENFKSQIAKHLNGGM